MPPKADPNPLRSIPSKRSTTTPPTPTTTVPSNKSPDPFDRNPFKDKNLPPTTALTTPTTAPTTTVESSNEPLDPFDRNPFKEGKYKVALPPKPVYNTPATQKAIEELTAKLISAIEARVPADRINEILYPTQRKEKQTGIKGLLEKAVGFDIIPDEIPLTRFLPGRGDTNIGTPGQLDIKPIKSFLIPTIATLQTAGRFVVSANEEAIQWYKTRVLNNNERQQTYTATDYIPVSQYTGLPIAKPGDAVISNWRDISAAVIPGIEKATNEAEAIAIQDKYVKEYARTEAGGFGDIVRAMKDFSYSASDNPYVPETGNPIIDGVIDFSYDLGLDPTTYASGGGSAFVKPLPGGVSAITSATSKAVAAATRREALRITAAKAAQRATEVAADVTATVVQKAAAKTAAEAAEKAAEKAFKEAAALAPKREFGREAREALAADIASAKVAAEQIVLNPASTQAQLKVAKDALIVLNDELIRDVAAKGYSAIRGEAANVLGVRSGMRIGLPFGKKITVPSLTQAGLNKLGSPYVARLSDIAGQGFANTRVVMFRTLDGLKESLNYIIPPGAGSNFISDTSIRTMRKELSKGKLAPDVAKDYVQILSANKAAAAAAKSATVSSGAVVNKVVRGEKGRVLDSITEALITPRSQWRSKGIVLDVAQQKAYDEYMAALKFFAKEANTKSAVVGARAIPTAIDSIPKIKSAAALEWAAKNPELVGRTADDLGVDKTFFTGPYVKTPQFAKGKTFLGTTLNGTESIADLNIISNKVLGFDFFETNAAKALSSYAIQHARYMSFLEGIKKLMDINPGAGATALDVQSIPNIVTTLTKRPGSVDDRLGSLNRTLSSFMNPDKLRAWNFDDVLKVRGELEELGDKLRNTDKLNVEAFDEAILNIDEKVIEINRLIDAKLIDPTMASLLQAQIEDFANSIALTIDNVRKDFLVTGPERWESVTRTILDGFAVLNKKTLPDVAAKIEIAEMFTNFQRLKDPAFVRGADALLGGLNTFFKSYSTLTPGFHNRNSLSMVFQAIAQGANPLESLRAFKLFVAYKSFLKKYEGKIISTKGIPGEIRPITVGAKKTDYIAFENIFEEFIKYARGKGLIQQGEGKLLDDALIRSNPSGGQAGEIAQEAGLGRPGFFGREATGTIPILNKLPGVLRGTQGVSRLPETVIEFVEKIPGLKKPFPGLMKKTPEQMFPVEMPLIGGKRVPFTGSTVGQMLGSPIYAGRSTGEWIEDAGRFMFMWDSLKKGLSPDAASAKVNKYYFDYGDVTTVNKVLKQINPFWTFAVKNAPLMIESMWMNPRAYTAFGALRNNLEDEENTSPFIREYRREAGAFKVPFTDVYLQPDFAFPGVGAPGLIQMLLSKNPEQILAGLAPSLRTIPEIRENKQFFSGAPITDERSASSEFDKWMYAARANGAPLSLIGRFANLTPARKYKIMQSLFGTKGKVGDEQYNRNLQINAGLSLFGVPGFLYTPDSEASDIWVKVFELIEETDKYNFRAREKEKEVLREAEIKNQQKENKDTIPTTETTIPGSLPSPFDRNPFKDKP